jgi:hypothetical protein
MAGAARTLEARAPASSSAARRTGADDPPAYELRAGTEPILRDAPELRAFLDETCRELRKVFGSAGQLAVTRFEDPEAPAGTPALFVLVRTMLDAKAAGDLLDRFDDAFWLDNAPRAGGLLEVSLEFA